MALEQKAIIRKQLLQLRSNLPSSTRQQAEKQIIKHLINHPDWQKARNIASYMAVRGEVDLTPLHLFGWRQQKLLFLPVLAKHKLIFASYTLDTTLEQNQYNIVEPQVTEGECLSAAQLDLLLIPVVGFDAHGNRLGMGKGYFDFTLESLINLPQRPLLMGVAYACQQVPKLPVDKWDVQLDVIVTEQGFIKCKP